MTYSDDSESKRAAGGKVLELDVHVKPRGDIDHALALYAEGKHSILLQKSFCSFLSFLTYHTPTVDNLATDGNDASLNGHQGFLEKNLSDFFDI